MVAPLQNQLQQQQKQSPNSSEMEKKKAFPSSGDAPWSSPSASFLQRRILFHPAFKTSSSSAAPSLKPINSPLLNFPRFCTSKQEASPLPSELHSAPQKLQEPELLPSMPIRRIGAGLENLGNTCFLNSVLQCLSYTPPLTAYLQSGQHKSFCRISGFCALCALESHVKHALAVPGRVVSPTNFVKNLRSISRSFCVGRQEDAHEYMRYLIESLQKCSLPVASHNDQSHKMQNLIYKVFGGRLRSQVKCMHCSFCSNTYDPFLDLSLEIVRAESLQKALARFTAVEELDGDNKYRCSKCNMKVKALKQFMVDKAPEILTIQLKRFSAFGGFGGKIDKKVQFDRTLDMRLYMSNGEDAPVKYSLYAVLVHSGNSTHSGHYYCFVRTATDMWHVLDDRRVSQVSEKTVLDQKAYILFYMRMPLSHSVPDLCKAPCKQFQDVHEEFVKQRPKLSNLEAAAEQNMFTIEPYLNGIATKGSIEKSKESNGTTHEAVQLKSESETFRIAKSRESKSNGNADVVMQLKTQPANASFDNLKTGSNNHIHSASQQRKQSENVFIDQPKEINSNSHIDEVRGRSKNDSTLVRSTSKRIEQLKPLCPADEAGSRSHKLYGVTVPAWDMDKDAAATRVIETLANGETRHCGHVLDDWEEDYDRGKRKKVRNRSNEIKNENMNGKNPFQALASTELHGGNHKGRMVKSQELDRRRLDNIKKGRNRDKHYHKKHKKLWSHSAKLQKRKTFQILAFKGLHHVISEKKKVKRQRTESSSSVDAKRRRSQS